MSKIYATFKHLRKIKIDFSAKPYKSILKKQKDIPYDETTASNEGLKTERPKSPLKTPRMDKKKNISKSFVKPIKSNSEGSKEKENSQPKQKKKLGRSLIESVKNIKKQTEEVQIPQTPKKTPLSMITKSKRFAIEDISDDSDSDDFDLSFKSFSMETLNLGTPKFCQVRRLKSSHCRSVDKMWLPGKSTQADSFNSKCSKKYTRDEDENERCFGRYYYSSQSFKSFCNHGKKTV